MKISPGLFHAYLKCPMKCWLRSAGEAATGNDFAEWVKTQDETYRTNETGRLAGEFSSGEVATSPEAEHLKSAKWRLATNVAVQAQVNSCIVESDLHAVERIPSEGRGRAAHFIPIRFIFRNKLTKDDKLLLAFDAFALSEVLGREISVGKIVHGDDRGCARQSAANIDDRAAELHDGRTTAALSRAQPRDTKVKPSALAGEVRKTLEKIAALLAGQKPPDLVLNRHCPECEFRDRCRQKAIETDDLSLLSGMSEKERTRHRSKGIFNVTQLSYTFRPRRAPKRAKNPAKPHHFALQALAIRENTVYIHGTPELPPCKSRVFLDIEGLPDRDFYYLIGVLVVADGQEAFHSFWADRESEQSSIFTRFAESISQLPDFRVFHFGDYDAAAMKQVATGLTEGPRQQLNLILKNSINVLSLVHPHVYFPTYSNRLKALGHHLGEESVRNEVSGLESIIWRDAWEAGCDASLKDLLLDYNRTDCLTLRKLTDFIALQTSSANEGEKNQTKVSRTSELSIIRPRWRMFAPKEYALEDLRHINKCGYFDYQREKIFVKTHKQFKKFQARQRKGKPRNPRPSKYVDLVRKKCPACGAKHMETVTCRQRYSLNLRFTRSGVRRAVTCIRCWDYRCLGCGGTATAQTRFSKQQIYGHELMSWCVYFNVVSGLNMLKVQKCLEDLFGLRVENAQLYRFKRYISASYLPLDNELLKTILNSPCIHLDETTVNLRDRTGYVWVVTSMDMVHFFYRPSREATFLTEMLNGFSGVLVSDFFTGYDSVRCLQQKCLVHVVRELDEDLVHNPFDKQFKVLAQGFGALLRPIIETVDCFGLRKRHLVKHKREVERFLKKSVDGLTPDSELVEKYRSRFIKYWPKMFTFLECDGVPWNNNNAEHAIKRFAKYRRNADGCYTERSLKEYLVLASTLETCDFNKVNVLKFLLAKETTLDGLLRMAGRMRQPQRTKSIGARTPGKMNARQE